MVSKSPGEVMGATWMGIVREGGEMVSKQGWGLQGVIKGEKGFCHWHVYCSLRLRYYICVQRRTGLDHLRRWDHAFA